jgi:hypothetical protein
MVGSGEIVMDGSGKIAIDRDSGDGQQWRRNGWWDSKMIAMGDGTRWHNGWPPLMQKRRNWRPCKMDGSGNHNGQWRHDWDGQRQRQWATTAAQWAVGQQSNRDGQ